MLFPVGKSAFDALADPPLADVEPQADVPSAHNAAIAAATAPRRRIALNTLYLSPRVMQ